jgi:hypothetical protein
VQLLLSAMASDIDNPPDEGDQQQDMPDHPDTPTHPHSPPETAIGSPIEADVGSRMLRNAIGARNAHQLSRPTSRETIRPAAHCTMSSSQPSGDDVVHPACASSSGPGAMLMGFL